MTDAASTLQTYQHFHAKSRDLSVDLLRVIACLFVIGTHSFDLHGSDFSKLFLKTVFIDGVSVFFVLAGFFMFRRGFRTTLVNYTKRVFIPGLLTILFVESYVPLYHGKNIFYCIVRIPTEVLPVIAKSLIAFMTVDDITGYLWYIFTYMMIVLAFPILKPLCNKNTPSKYRIYIIFLTWLYLLLSEMNELHVIPLMPGLTKLLPSSFMWALCGYEIYDRKEQIKGNKKVRALSLLFYITVIFFRAFWQYRICLLEPANTYYVLWNRSFSILSSAALIVFILSFRTDRAGRVVQGIAKAGSYTLLIYLIHAPFMTFLNHFGFRSFVNRLVGGGGEMFLLQEISFLAIRMAADFLGSLAIAVLLTRLKKQFLSGTLYVRKKLSI